MTRGSGLPPLNLLDPLKFDGRSVPEREWIVPGLIPRRQVTILSGDGGLGKSLLALQLMAACSLGIGGAPRQWLGREATPCKVFGVFCEDDRDELHRRLADVLRHYGAAFGDLEGMMLNERVGTDSALMTWERDFAGGQPTGIYGQILAHATDSGAQLTVLDSLHDFFPGLENSRVHARQFVNLLRVIATETDGAVLLNAHPSLSGRNTGTGESGSTAWNNAVRSRLYLTRPDGAGSRERTLKTMKANYASDGGEIPLRWSDGVLVPIEQGGMVASLERSNAETAFLAALAGVTADGRNVSESRNSGNYAPRLFLTRPEARGFKIDELRGAMERLFAAGKLRVESYGRPSDQRRRIVATKPDSEETSK